MLNEERPGQIGQVEADGIVRPIGILMRHIVEEGEEQLVAIGVSGLPGLCVKLRLGRTGHGGDRGSFKIERIEVEQHLRLDLRDLIEVGRVER